jgi:hypothetical protein
LYPDSNKANIMTSLKPSWYSSKNAGAVSDFINLLHPPYTLWHLSYVLIGIAMSPVIFLGRSVAVLVAFFLGLGLGAHALDETMGNPLRTRISKRRLYFVGFVSLSVAILIGIYYVVELSILILPFVAIESFFAVAYNLEVFEKRFHTDIVFALSWGSIPFLTGYFVNSLSFSIASLVMAVGIGLLTYVQRTLSTQARLFRRKIETVQSINLASGESIPMSSQELISPAEKSLKALTIMIFALSVALILTRLPWD